MIQCTLRRHEPTATNAKYISVNVQTTTSKALYFTAILHFIREIHITSYHGNLAAQLIPYLLFKENVEVIRGIQY